MISILHCQTCTFSTFSPQRQNIRNRKVVMYLVVLPVRKIESSYTKWNGCCKWGEKVKYFKTVIIYSIELRFSGWSRGGIWIRCSLITTRILNTIIFSSECDKSCRNAAKFAKFAKNFPWVPPSYRLLYRNHLWTRQFYHINYMKQTWITLVGVILPNNKLALLIEGKERERGWRGEEEEYTRSSS